MKQSHRHSVFEAMTNSVSGVLTGYLSNLYILPLLGFHVDAKVAGVITVIFTAISLVRSYVVRRLFNCRA